VLEQLKSRGGSVIFLIEQDNAETAVRAMQIGAEYCLTKPVDLNYLNAATARVCDKVRLMRQHALLREALDRLLSMPWPGKGRELQKVFERLPADLRKGGTRGERGNRRERDGRHQPRPSPRWSGRTSKRRSDSTRATARARPRTRDFARDADQQD